MMVMLADADPRLVARLVEKIDWTLWGERQMIREHAGKGATSLIRQMALRVGLRAQVDRAGVDVIFVTLTEVES